jgi:hypothetical protein
MPVKFYIGVNLGANNVGLAVNQATAYANQMPSGALDAIEIGNEPDLYGIQGLRPASYSFQDYLAQFNIWKTQIMPSLPPLIKFLGPSTVDAGWLPETESFLAAEASVLNAFSQHYYFGDGKANNADDILLSPGASTTGPKEVAAAVNTSHQFGIPFRIGEMNSLSSGGEQGISNAFGSALWAVDIMFEFAQVGVEGVNWHTNSCCAYDAFEFDSHGTGASTTYSLTSVNPLYYGLLFFQEATGNGAHLLPVTLTTEANLKAWATVDASDTTRLVLLNKDETAAGTVTVQANGFSQAQVLRLTAPSYLSTSGVVFAGQTFDGSTTGMIQGSQTVENVAASQGVFQIPMPVTSAALVIFK